MKVWLIAGLAVGAVLVLSRSASASDNADDSPMGPNPNPNPNPSGDDAMTEEIRQLALAIAHAEGFFVAGAIPKQAHNPGDLVIPGWTGATLGDQRISVFTNDDEGWRRLYHQLNLIFSDASHVYARSMTFAEMGATWTQTQAGDWTRNVLTYLNAHGYTSVTADSTLEDFFDGTYE